MDTAGRGFAGRKHLVMVPGMVPGHSLLELMGLILRRECFAAEERCKLLYAA